ncbi:unnamed protein product [Allacma fusca]|uniref:Uncharacterized protein n=1 Tax=Allacma fusca TaxID=39272 RepID=A0A8J2PHR6_9HEXA|nr:unnamed protein product [Allacma fusca]
MHFSYNTAGLNATDIQQVPSWAEAAATVLPAPDWTRTETHGRRHISQETLLTLICIELKVPSYLKLILVPCSVPPDVYHPKSIRT